MRVIRQIVGPVGGNASRFARAPELIDTAALPTDAAWR